MSHSMVGLDRDRVAGRDCSPIPSTAMAPDTVSDRPRCHVVPPAGREACRYPVTRPGTDRCTLHMEYPGRRVDVRHWCAAWRPVLNAPCQAYVVPGSTFCPEHDGRPSTRLAPTSGDSAPIGAPTSGNGHYPLPPRADGSGPPPSRRRESADLAKAPPAPRAARSERQARSAVIATMGNNPAAILITIGIVVETGRGPLTWSSFQKAAEREGLLTPPAAPLATMLLGALGPR
jgi:hypothetical protein